MSEAELSLLRKQRSAQTVKRYYDHKKTVRTQLKDQEELKAHVAKARMRGVSATLFEMCFDAWSRTDVIVFKSNTQRLSLVCWFCRLLLCWPV